MGVRYREYHLPGGNVLLEVVAAPFVGGLGRREDLPWTGTLTLGLWNPVLRRP